MSATSTARSFAAATATAGARPRWVHRALARADGRRLLTHRVFGLGMAISVVTLALASGRLPVGAIDKTETVSFLAGDCFVMLGAAIWTFLVASLGASREHRDEARDFYAAAPVSPGSADRGRAHVAGVRRIGGCRAHRGRDDAAGRLGCAVVDAGRRYAVSPLELAQGPLYLVLAGAFGVLVGSWTRHVYAAAFGAVVLFLPPVALLPWFVLDDGMSRGFYGAVMVGAGPAGI